MPEQIEEVDDDDGKVDDQRRRPSSRKRRRVVDSIRPLLRTPCASLLAFYFAVRVQRVVFERCAVHVACVCVCAEYCASRAHDACLQHSLVSGLDWGLLAGLHACTCDVCVPMYYHLFHVFVTDLDVVVDVGVLQTQNDDDV